MVLCAWYTTACRCPASLIARWRNGARRKLSSLCRLVEGNRGEIRTQSGSDTVCAIAAGFKRLVRFCKRY